MTFPRTAKNNLFNLTAVLLAGLLLTAGCQRTSTDADDADAEQVVRGRLKMSKDVKALRIGNEYLFRDVKQYFFVDGKPWAPEDDKNLAQRIGWCDTSPNPAVEILRCSSDAEENYAATYIVRMKNDRPEVQRIPEGGGSVWADNDGRWLFFRKHRVNVETGESIEIKGMPFADDPSASSPVTYVIAVSPDLKTVVAMPDSATVAEGGEEFLRLRIIDTESGRVDYRRASYTKNPWLKDWENPKGDIQPPPAPSKSFVWRKNAAGRDEIAVPALLTDPKKK
ncbi:MAG: hypothetical protein JSS81_01440 [Acidobacteria bacterium]|nr:hypothetical protein [Acidobacteriota bacterium]